MMGYWEEKRKYEELKNSKNVKFKKFNDILGIGTCVNCGKIGTLMGRCGGWHFLKPLAPIALIWGVCKDCGFRCKKCKKVFCPKHKKSHSC